MTHETTPDGHIILDDSDFVDEPEQAAPVREVHVPSESVARKHLEMPLPKTDRPAQEDDLEMLDRVQQWDRDFKLSAQRGLREAFGYKTATVLDFECLMGRPGHDENDYELTVQVGSTPDAKVGEEGGHIIKIVVRRASEDALRS